MNLTDLRQKKKTNLQTSSSSTPIHKRLELHEEANYDGSRRYSSNCYLDVELITVARERDNLYVELRDDVFLKTLDIRKQDLILKGCQ